MPGKVMRAPGGVGRNVAENLVHLGIATELISVFGSDPFSNGLMAHARRAGIGLGHSLQLEGEGCWSLSIFNHDHDLQQGVADLTAMEQLGAAELAARLPELQEASAIVVDANCSEEALAWIAATWTDHRLEIIDMIAEEDKVWCRLTSSGIHKGEWMGIAPTGKQWTNSGVGFLTFIEGRIAEIVWFFDVFNHISQLGATFTTT
jgi:hypothetical protein